MKRPRICVSLLENNLGAIKEVEPLIDLFEVRLDLVGSGWPELVKFIKNPRLVQPESRGNGTGSANEVSRVEELMWAARIRSLHCRY